MNAAQRAAGVEKMRKAILGRIAKIEVRNPSYISVSQQTLERELDRTLLSLIATESASAALAAWEQHEAEIKESKT